MSDVALKYFYAAAVHGSMRAASQKLNVAVSSISRQIAQLEASLGLPLLETGRRSIKLTLAGQLAFDFYQAQMTERDAFAGRLEALRGLKAGVVELAIGEGYPVQSLLTALDAFQASHPGIELIVTSARPEEIVRMIVDDEAHAALGLAIPADPKLRVRACARQPLNLIVRPDHPLAEARGVTLQELARHDLCLEPRGARIRQLLAAAELRQQIWLKPVITANSVQTMREMALLGRAATILPRMAVLPELDAGALVGVPLEGLEIEDARLDLVTRLGRQLPPAAALALSVIEQQLNAWCKAGVGARSASQSLVRAEG